MVPDSYFREVNRLLQEDRDIKSVTATREDEGMAICAGAYMGGKNPCMVMEASGYGSGAGVLARICQIHHTPFLILSSHVAGLGGTQHELFTLGDRDANLYATGIGLVSQVALGLAIALPKRKIIALDGDGSLLLNLGILPVLAQQTPPNLLVVVFDNGLYESGGNTATLSASGADLAALASGAGIANTKIMDSLDAFSRLLKTALEAPAFNFLVIRVKPGGLPVTPKGMSGVENKFRFIRHIEATEGKRILSIPIRTSQKLSS